MTRPKPGSMLISDEEIIERWGADVLPELDANQRTQKFPIYQGHRNRQNVEAAMASRGA